MRARRLEEVIDLYELGDPRPEVRDEWLRATDGYLSRVEIELTALLAAPEAAVDSAITE